MLRNIVRMRWLNVSMEMGAWGQPEDTFGLALPPRYVLKWGGVRLHIRYEVWRFLMFFARRKTR